MGELKLVKDVSVVQGLMSTRVQIVLKKGIQINSNISEKVAVAVEQLVTGRTLVLSGTCIELHNSVPTKSDVIEMRALEIVKEELRQANAKILALQGDVEAYKGEAARLQKVVDEASDGINKLHHNSTRVKEARERFIKRRSGNGIF